jgi:hypothetical protein
MRPPRRVERGAGTSRRANSDVLAVMRSEVGSVLSG